MWSQHYLALWMQKVFLLYWKCATANSDCLCLVCWNNVCYFVQFKLSDNIILCCYSSFPDPCKEKSRSNHLEIRVLNKNANDEIKKKITENEFPYYHVLLWVVGTNFLILINPHSQKWIYFQRALYLLPIYSSIHT